MRINKQALISALNKIVTQNASMQSLGLVPVLWSGVRS